MEKAPYEDLSQYVGRTMEVPGGKQRIDGIKNGNGPETVLVTLTGLDADGKQIYSEEKEILRVTLEKLYGSI